jgi:D-alanyl-lipoteichoic acid acyltransferase DltB (MBOAT superfamily)
MVFICYWFLARKNLKAQNGLLLLASYFFYACWDYRFLFLLMFSTLLDYFTGLKMHGAEGRSAKRWWFWLSIGINLGFLAVFKYYNFFAESFAGMLGGFGMRVNVTTLQVILPVGISFYTFHGLSYVIDIYKDKIKPEKNLVDYSLFVSFFPLLVAGPIERATHLLPQIKAPREFHYTKAVDGLRQILWGLFKKIVIADNCAAMADFVFNNSADYSGSTLLIGAVFFAFQIYGDFSGYSDIAIGTAKLFGIDLLRNFAFPYFSRDIAEFWRRWHISLSSWFRDYLYIPLGGSKAGAWKAARNTLIIFIVSGLWHGANWTFIAWGLLNAVYILPSIVFRTNRNNLDVVAQGRLLPGGKELLSMLVTFSLCVFAWIFFRAENLGHAFQFITDMFSRNLFRSPEGDAFLSAGVSVYILFILLGLFMLVEWMGRERNHALAGMGLKVPLLMRWPAYIAMISCLFYFSGQEKAFIYFQF